MLNIYDCYIKLYYRFINMCMLFKKIGDIELVFFVINIICYIKILK